MFTDRRSFYSRFGLGCFRRA